MSREQILRNRLAPAVRSTLLRSTLLRSTLLGLVVALAASGCAAGQVTQTDAQVASVNGAMADLGPIALRDVVLAYPGGENVFGYEPGDDVPLLLTIVNSGDQADELVSVTTPAASEVVIEGTTTIPGSFAVTSVDDAGTAGELRSPTPSAAIPLNPADPPLAFGELNITLTGLTGPIRPGLPTFITFRFRDAGPVELRVPIDAPAETRIEGAEDSPPGDEQIDEG
ncbi:MAG: copper chaperone PCu(A)C [Actinobacteria bacterium]|nr:copper chaperone PCu(A)C [Actinomycetota bacterium]